MDISFQKKKLEKLANDDQKMDRKLGKIQAEKVRTRLAQLQSADTLEDTRNLPGNYHELVNDRKGQWACDLDQPNRLIFTPQENPIPENNSGQYIWSKIKGVEIIEIINYHNEK